MLVAQQQPPLRVLSQSPPRSSSHHEKERELSPKVSAADVQHQIAQPPHLSPRRHAQQPHIVISRPQPSSKDREKEAEHGESSQSLQISSSPRLRHNHRNGKSHKPFDPQHDPTPTKRSGGREDRPVDGLSEREKDREPRKQEIANTTSRGNPLRQLFDRRKDDPIRFSVLARPQPPQQPQAQITSEMSSETRTAPKYLPNDHVSASSTSTSYAASLSSSVFTLSPTTNGSSASSAPFEGRGGQGQGNGTDDSGNNAFSIQLKKLYRALSNLETKIRQEEGFVRFSIEDVDVGMSGVMVVGGKEREKGLATKGKCEEMSVPYAEPGEVEQERWKMIIEDHKECVYRISSPFFRGVTPFYDRLAEISHNLLEISLSPSVPASLRNIPMKYNIIVRLWTYGFHKLLESLRHASFNSPLALEHLQDFIYYAYSFYTGLLEEPNLSSFRSGWLEALGDLARYRMAVATMVSGGVGGSGFGGQLTSQAVSEATAIYQSAEAKKEPKNSSNSTKSLSDHPAARIDDSPSPSIGIAAARLMDVEPETERWRQIAREWYGASLAEQPGVGKLHHRLGLLEREVGGEELRGCYHFVKRCVRLFLPKSIVTHIIISMTTLHPFPTSRESILPLFSQPLQACRASPDSHALELFVLLHGMLFTHIQLDSFNATKARFIERLALDGAEEREWLMMAVVNIGAILEYGKAGGVVRRFGGFSPKEGGGNAAGGAVQAQAETTMIRVIAKKAAAGVPGVGVRPVTMVEKERMDVDDEGREKDRLPIILAAETASDMDLPPAYKYALQLTFTILSFVLKKPTSYARSTLNPYLTVILTFLATLVKHKNVLKSMERDIPWEEMAGFFSCVPKKVMILQGLIEGGEHGAGEQWVTLVMSVGNPWVISDLPLPLPTKTPTHSQGSG